MLVVDDDPLVRAGLTVMLDVAPTTSRWSARPATATRPSARSASTRPDVVLMDIRMPRRRRPARHRAHPCAGADAPHVIVLTTFDADDHVLRALRAGASGFLLKDTPPPEILRAVRLVARASRCSPRRSRAG